MFITKKKHDKIAATLREEIAANEKTIAYLKQEVANAQNLKSILDKLANNYLSFGDLLVSGSGGITVNEINGIKAEDIAHYVPDHFGGRCIKQEATKVIEISAAGDITTGLTTKLKPESGFGYVLVQKGQ